MARIKRLLAALIARQTGNADALEEDRSRAAELCAAGQLTAEEYAAILALLPATTTTA